MREEKKNNFNKKPLLVSIIIPCRNEERYIKTVLDNLIEQDFPKENLEVLFADGLSTDATKKIIESYCEDYSWMRIFDNINKTVPYAMNLGIEKSKGEIIIRMDAHASYPKKYVSKLVEWLYKLNADNVGGLWITKPSSAKLKAKAIALALSHPFGVGNAYFRIGVKDPKEADTVPFGCYNRKAFEKSGLYDLRLVRNQDIELNKRLKSNGGKIFLVPDVYCIYFARDSFAKLIKNNFKNGEWVILTSYYTKSISSLSFRHFIPLFFTGYLFLLPFLFLISKLFLIPFVFYLLLNIYSSFKIVINEKNFRLVPLLAYAFLVLHISYGIGSFYGIWRLLIRKV